MNTSKPSIDYLRRDSTSLGPLFNRLAQIKAWHRCLAASLSREDQLLLTHCHVIHADATNLVILVDSPHWATRLRFLTPKLIASLRQQPEFAKLAVIQHKVAPPVGKPVSKKRTVEKQIISSKNAKLLRETAEGIQHSGLKAALKKLAGS